MRPRSAAPLILAALFLSGCAASASSTSSSTPPPPSSSAPAAQPSTPALAAPSDTSSPPPCTTHACIVADAKQLVGSVAKDESVITAMNCRQSSVHHAGPGIWTVSCTATYSDGSQVGGIATVLLSTGQLTWEPTG